MSTLEEVEKAVEKFSGYVSCFVGLYFVFELYGL